MAIVCGVNHIGASLVDGKNVSRNRNADVLHGRFGGSDTRAIAIDTQAAHYIDKDDVLAEVIAGRLCTVAHKLHKVFFVRPFEII